MIYRITNGIDTKELNPVAATAQTRQWEKEGYTVKCAGWFVPTRIVNGQRQQICESVYVG